MSDRSDEKENLLRPVGDSSEESVKKEPWHGCPWQTKSYVKLGVFLAIVAVLAVLGVVFREQVAYAYGQFVAFMGPTGPFRTFLAENRIAAPFVYVGVYILFSVFLLPGSVLTILAGIIWPNVFEAFGIVSLASTIGATIAALLGRTLLRGWVIRKISAYPTFVAIESAVSKTSWLVLLLRLSPVIPFNILNYALGITAVPMLHYVVFSWLGMIPGTFLYVYIGFFANGVVDPTSSLLETILKFVVGPIVTIVSVVVVTIVARRELKKQLDKDAKAKANANADETIAAGGATSVNDGDGSSSNPSKAIGDANDAAVPKPVMRQFESKYTTM